MIEVAIPGFGDLNIKYLVLDYNGTLAKDGTLLTGVSDLLVKLAEVVEIYVITADTFGSVAVEMKDLPVKITTIDREDERYSKLTLIKELGSYETASIGNGSNDEWMLKESRIGIGIIGQEGCSLKALQSADVAVHHIQHALELFLYPNRLKATLRY
ncbi:HAD family hydrolase [Bacillus tuaregi]|uniref:HAD family hydrolase n=1 Tax=Bacillus tuaregi TaxID=1816695 RepID=UPI0008F947D1|nr:HAD family hydrolase [Bacillus tuaregi]